MPDNHGAVHLGAPTEDIDNLPPEVRQRLEDMAEETGVKPEESKATPVDTAFVVFISEEGEVAVGNYDGSALLLSRNPTSDLIYGAVSTVQKDLAASETAQAVISMQMMQMRQMQEQAQAAAIQAQLGRNVGRV